MGMLTTLAGGSLRHDCYSGDRRGVSVLLEGSVNHYSGRNLALNHLRDCVGNGFQVIAGDPALHEIIANAYCCFVSVKLQQSGRTYPALKAWLAHSLRKNILRLAPDFLYRSLQTHVISFFYHRCFSDSAQS